MRSADDAADDAARIIGSSPTAAETVQDALDILGDLLLWRFSAERWDRVEPVVIRMWESVAADDEAALRDATATLELMGPTRITRIGDTPVIAPPPKIWERANQLIHSLGGDVAGTPDPSAPPEVPEGNSDGESSDR